LHLVTAPDLDNLNIAKINPEVLVVLQLIISEFFAVIGDPAVGNVSCHIDFLATEQAGNVISLNIVMAVDGPIHLSYISEFVLEELQGGFERGTAVGSPGRGRDGLLGCRGSHSEDQNGYCNTEFRHRVSSGFG
jgi:hypothetical protein